MKALSVGLLGLAVAVTGVNSRFVSPNDPRMVVLYPSPAPLEKFLIELSPEERRWVTEDEKWALRRDGLRFMDITEARDLGTLHTTSQRRRAVFPTELAQQAEVGKLLKKLSKANMQANLDKLTSFYTRYYKSDTGRQSSQWLLQTVIDAIRQSGADKYGTLAMPYPHTWTQSSVIATIPGRTNRTIVIGAHQDSINLWAPSLLAAPGADDDGSGTVTTLETFRALLQSDDLVHGRALNTIEFHWYSAEESGLLGSQDIFRRYEAEGRDVRAMLQQDMTGFVTKTIEAGLPETVAVVTDFVDPALTNYTKMIIDEYCTIPWLETTCGYACSDHASALKAGYPSAFATESSLQLSDSYVHTTEDVVKYLSFDHMFEHARLSIGLAYELAYADFDALDKAQDDAAELRDL